MWRDNEVIAALGDRWIRIRVCGRPFMTGIYDQGVFGCIGCH